MCSALSQHGNGKALVKRLSYVIERKPTNTVRISTASVSTDLAGGTFQSVHDTEAYWAVLGLSWAVAGLSWPVLPPAFKPLGPSWGDLGGLFSRFAI